MSNVLNDHPSIRPQTRERVLRAIEALDYHPNIAAKALRESRVTTICCGFYDHSPENIADPYRNLVQSAFMAEATAQGYDTTTAFLNSDVPRTFDAFRASFLQQRFAGVVLVGTSVTPERLDLFSRWNMPTVLLDHTEPSPVLPVVTADYRSGMEQLVTQLALRGHQHLALIIPPGDRGGSAVARREGFLAAAHRHGLQTTTEPGNWSSESGETAFSRLWSRTPRPDAVLCANDRMAAGALYAARTMGVRVPADVRITGFDDFEFARYTAPSLTTIHVPLAEMARAAVKLLLAEIEYTRSGQPRGEPVFLKMPVTLIERESAAC
ncbi:LacI family transcriptional regulator (plasmid) [Deinococcus sp. KNUC1210]|uniref:LacI family DNA-binding transcriptional regulator n=1 Tax=Deinococcus sp. KNUC1210 TaxID=2917691 RepID=UPI001EEF7A38|nr:LacI family DNA-binding transcriptional regulator [Deinococcus sp. KNUC1210]ULH17505.1 LacI family transcriptional regulator [Deinococcus sp. KNUC1210]